MPEATIDVRSLVTRLTAQQCGVPIADVKDETVIPDIHTLGTYVAVAIMRPMTFQLNRRYTVGDVIEHAEACLR